MTEAMIDSDAEVWFRNRINGEVSNERLRLTLSANADSILFQLHERDGGVILRVMPSEEFVEILCRVLPPLMQIMQTFRSDSMADEKEVDKP